MRSEWVVLCALVACGNAGPESVPEDTCSADVCPDGFTLTIGADREIPAPTTLPHGPVSIVVGDLANTGVLQVYVGTNSTVTRLDGDGWGTATDIWTQPDDGAAVHPLIADLTADGVADLVIGLPGSDGGSGQVVIFPGPVTDPVDWDTPHFELKGGAELSAGHRVSAADLDGDGALDLVARGSGVVWVVPGPLLADALLGADTDSVWTSSADARIVGASADGDIDGDGSADLVLTVKLGTTGACGGTEWALRIATGPLTAGSFSPEDASLALPPPTGAILGGVVAIDDIDGDGAADILCLGFTPGLWPLAALIYTGPVTAGAEPDTRFAVLGDFAGAGDFDGDGTADLLQASHMAAESGSTIAALLSGPLDALSIYPADCAFHVTETWTSPTSQSYPEAVWTGDLDGDGIADAVLATSASTGEGLVQVVLGVRS